MNRIALYHIETLLWISRLGTFSAAAARMNTSQPSVSTRMRELEHLTGVTIFRREGRRMLLTVRGRQMVQEFEPLWYQIEKMLQPDGSVENLVGIIKIGCGEIAAIRCLPGFLSDMSKELPRLSVEVDVDLTVNLRHKLESGLIDMAVMVGPIDDQVLMAHSIGRIKMQWCISKALHELYPFATVPELMTNLPIWCLSRPSHLYQLMTETLRQSDLRQPAINTCNNVRALIDTILQGGGAAILPEALVRPQLDSGELISFSSPRYDSMIEFFCAIRRSEGDPVVQAVLQRARGMNLN
jgi:DNA-binding transcriptional LysR family regulator